MSGHINFEDLELKFGYSCMPNRLHFYSKEENDFRMEVREWCEIHVTPDAEQIDRNRDIKLAVKILKKLPYLDMIIPKEAGGQGKGILIALF